MTKLAIKWPELDLRDDKNLGAQKANFYSFPKLGGILKGFSSRRNLDQFYEMIVELIVDLHL